MNCNRQSVIEVAPELVDRVIGHVATIPLRGDRMRRRYSAIDARGRRGRACRGHDGACALSAMLAVLSEFGLAAAAEVPLLPEPPLPVT